MAFPFFQNTIDAGSNAPLLNLISQATGMTGKVAPAENRSVGDVINVPSVGGTQNSYALSPTQQAAQAAASKEAALVGSLQSSAQARINQLNDLYNSIYGQVDQSVGSQRQALDQGYKNQYDTLNHQFEQNAAQLPWIFAAKGTAGSTDQGMAQDTAGQNYADSSAQIKQDQDSKNAALGQFAAQQKAGYHATQDVLNSQPLGQFTTSYGLQNYINQLNQNYVDAQKASAGFGTNQAYQQQLNAIAPSQNNGAAQLQQQLTDLSKASVPQFAKDQVASAAINSSAGSGQDPTYWMNYYKNLVSGGGATTV